jgi:GntR family transcriptional regulator
MPLDFENARPLYRQVADEIRRKIQSGAYAPGEQLPTERALQAEYDVSRDTVRLAIGVLKAEGLVAARQGRGTFVARRPPVRLRLARHSRTRRQLGAGPFEASARAKGLHGTAEVVRVEQRTADADLAALMEIPEGSGVIWRLRHMYASKGPSLLDGRELVQMQESHFPLDLVAGTAFAEPEKIEGGTYAALDGIGHGPVSCTEEVGARMPTADEAAVLHPAEGVPVLTVTRITREQSGRVVEVLFVVALGDRNTFVYKDLPID